MAADATTVPEPAWPSGERSAPSRLRTAFEFCSFLVRPPAFSLSIPPADVGAPPAQEEPMSEQKESSVLFSLKELMNLEEDRIKQEESARQRQVAAEAQARVDAERRARDEEDARIKAEDDRRR